MGIKGLFSFLQRWEQPCSLEGLRLGVDLFYFLHRSKGNRAVIERMLEPYGKMHAVVDGRMKTEEREEELEGRRAQRKRAWEEWEQLNETPMEELDGMGQKLVRRQMSRLSRQVWTPSREYVEEVCAWIRERGGYVHEPDGEADAYLVGLEREGVVDVVVSNDSDLMVLGARRLVRPVPFLRNLRLERSERLERGKERNTKRSTRLSKVCADCCVDACRDGRVDAGSARILDSEWIRSQLGFSPRQWEDFLFICSRMREQDVVLSYSLISVYKRKEVAVERWEEVNGGRLLRG